MLSNLDPKVLDKIAPIGTTHPSRNQMLSVKAALALANENTDDERGEVIRATLVAVRKFLIANPSECKIGKLETAPSAISKGGSGRGCKHGEHGTSECISKFLSGY